jgi:hypothetical protein
MEFYDYNLPMDEVQMQNYSNYVYKDCIIIIIIIIITSYNIFSSSP